MKYPFHLAIPVHDLELAFDFYAQVLGCSVGRRDSTWVDFNMYGHQVVTHLSPKKSADAAVNPVDDELVPVPHFGVVLPWEEWRTLADRLEQHGLPFIIRPTIRFEGQVGEQATMFIRDPSGNALEFKSFQDPDQLFATE